MELEADVTALSYHLRRALDVLKGETPLDVSQIQEAERALENCSTGDAGCEWVLRSADSHWNDEHYHTTCSRTWPLQSVKDKLPFMVFCPFCGKGIPAPPEGKESK
jgi:hypothetical protein